MKTYYELLGLEPAADADAIKKAFRREIARYHPDKVVHLGPEFQEMAAVRAAELTVAYKTLSDASLRAQYDAAITTGAPPPVVAPPRAAPDADDDYQPFQTPPVEDHGPPAPPPGTRARFASERADRDTILKRAIGGRVLAAVEALYGKVETPAVRGFDLAIVPLAKPRFLGTPPPRVLVKVVDVADAAAISDGYAAASRSRVQTGKSPVVVLLFSRRIAPQEEISKANEVIERQRKAPDAPAEVAVVVVDTGDWSCRLPQNSSAAVRKLTAHICG
ncbi:MAG TPA: DnaJ domain-containing protein [Vicinamibacterales bacterium]|nr:DnaJ domain-containing protein [Vicinamibacterales bacterium]